MTDLLTWLRAQLDDIERVTRAKLGDPYGCWWLAIDEGAPSPDAVLADIAAKRTLLDEYERTAEEYARHKRDLDAGPSVQRLEFLRAIVVTTSTMTSTLGHAIQLLAYAYRDRPGYLPEWSPARSET